jgi:hypothetical protein
MSTLIKAYDRGKVAMEAVANRLARLNLDTHQKVPKTVGDRCLIAWRSRRDGFHHSGGGQFAFAKTTREQGPMLPTIGRGMDLRALVRGQLPIMKKHLDSMLSGEKPDLDVVAIKAELARMPSAPDENLR